MSKETNNPFGITQDELLNLAAQKLIDELPMDECLMDFAHQKISEHISKLFGDKLKTKVDDFLKEEMQRIVSTKVQPVDIYGDTTGKPTTIRDTLTERAKIFWEVKVDDEGRETTYGGIARSERMMRDICKEEFVKAIQANTQSIVAGFKAALERDASVKIKEFIDNLIRTK